MMTATATVIFFVIAIGLALLIPLLAMKVRGSERRVTAIEQQLERSQDEVWELKSAAAARDKAEAASEAKSRFLATVSHEIRTPLNGILGLADLLAATPLNAEQMSYLAAIRASGGALSSLINEILDFSRLEAGKLELRPSEFDLPALIEGTVELLSPRAQGKGIEVCSIVDKRLPRLIVADADRLRQVLINLVGNAVKFTERGGVGVNVTQGLAGTLRFSVVDTGPGIHISQRNSIFQYFEQGDGSPTRRHEGTGLGLAISRRIVEHMGGKLWLEESGPHGSHFRLDIPIEMTDAFRPREFEPLFANQKILIVGDTPYGCNFLAHRLADAGGQAFVARDGNKAAEQIKARDFEPNLVIVDCSLGEKAISELSALSRGLPRSRSVLLFSPFERREFGDAMLKDFDGWLVKPIRLEFVVEKLANLFNHEERKNITAVVDPCTLSLSGKHILLAEDNDVNALLVERQLCKLGATVLRARDGEDAVRFVTQSFAGSIRTFAAVLMDLRMPNLDGLSATKQIRTIENSQLRPPIQIIALTANAFDDDRDAAIRAGIQTFMTKPVDLTALVETLLRER